MGVEVIITTVLTCFKAVCKLGPPIVPKALNRYRALVACFT